VFIVIKYSLFECEEKISKIQKTLICWEQANYDSFPWRETNSDFHALIAEMMLQRTKAEQVLNIYQEFVEKYPSIMKAVKADPKEVRRLLKPLGLNWRIDNIIKLIELLGKKGKVPHNYSELLELPGIGQYVASAYLTLHKNECLPLIDSNAVRLWGRLFGLEINRESRRNKKFIELVKKITPSKNCRLFNLGVLDLTRKICKTIPNHNKCPLNLICEYYFQSKE